MGKQDRSKDMQGEGDRRSARRYNEHLKKAHDEGKLEGRDAAPDSEEQAEDLERAEKTGKRKAKELDPAVHRDWNEAERND